jgi:hypothetical protein
MKLIASIMAFVVLLLMVQPAMAIFHTPEEAECGGGCCKSETQAPATENEDHEEDDCGANCNPFVSCSACGAYTADFVTLTIFNPSITIAKAFPFSQHVYSQFSPDFWQPPKLS